MSERNTTEVKCVLLSDCIRRHLRLIYPIPGDITRDHLVRAVAASFSTAGLLFFLL